MRLIAGLLMGFAFASGLHSRAESESNSKFDGKGQKYLPHVVGYLLPLFLVLLLIVWRFQLGVEDTKRAMVSMLFRLFLHISVYYALLLPLFPYLRKRISARACATLWLIPNYLYLFQMDSMDVNAPLVIITAPGNLVWILMSIWFSGFVGVLIWKIGSHLIFRKQLLKQAKEAPLAVRQQWKHALSQAKHKDTDILLMVSPDLSTPVTVGLFQSTAVVVLPDRNYTRDELELIFLHEIIHIGRMDTWNKFFLVFCTAMCWFNPLMWLAARKSAEDLELSCDETVLLDSDEDTRKKYAELLLRTAGDGRGFTTCLSASAKALRYRLKSIVVPAERSTGAILVGVCFLLLTLTYGYIGLAYDKSSGNEILFQSDNHSSYVLTVQDTDLPVPEQELLLADSEGILEYLSGLELYRLSDGYDFQVTNRKASVKLDISNATDLYIFIQDHTLEIYKLDVTNTSSVFYYVPDGIDWSLLDSLISGS